ncbi:RuvB-like helicase 2 [Dictyocoela muelleri]|nr:RuvB-like helicase 2 [Dictyocoela muelleri]
MDVISMNIYLQIKNNFTNKKNKILIIIFTTPLMISSHEIPSFENTTYHSHICGLGTHGKILSNSDGLVQLQRARIAFDFIKNMIVNGRAFGFFVIISGPSDSGKTALSNGFVKELKKENEKYFTERLSTIGTKSKVIFSSNKIKYPINIISGTRISNYFNHNNTDLYQLSNFIIQELRRSTAIRIIDKTVVIEGEVVDLDLDGLKKITLKTSEMESVFEIGDKMINEIEKLQILPGDIVRIKKNSGEIIKVGSTKISEYTFDSEIMKCPEGELMSLVEDEKLITLYELDTANKTVDQNHLNTFKSSRNDSFIDFDTRNDVDKKVEDWIYEGICEVSPGVLIIDEAEYLDEKIIEIIYNLTELAFAPAIIISINDEKLNKNKSDVLKRIMSNSMVIQTEKYSDDEFLEILKIKVDEENIEIEDKGILKLVEISKKNSLIYGINLIKLLKVEFEDKKVSENDLKIIIEMFDDNN